MYLFQTVWSLLLKTGASSEPEPFSRLNTRKWKTVAFISASQRLSAKHISSSPILQWKVIHFSFSNWLDVVLLAYAEKMIVLLISFLVTWFALQVLNRATLWGWGGGAEEEKKPFLLDPHFWKSLLLAGYPWKGTTGAVIEFLFTVIDWKFYLRDSVTLWTKLRSSAYGTMGRTIRKVMGGGGGFSARTNFFFSPTACGGIFFSG